MYIKLDEIKIIDKEYPWNVLRFGRGGKLLLKQWMECSRAIKLTAPSPNSLIKLTALLS